MKKYTFLYVLSIKIKKKNTKLYRQFKKTNPLFFYIYTISLLIWCEFYIFFEKFEKNYKIWTQITHICS